MILKQLSLAGFKNYGGAKAAFSPNINCLIGNNGVGKTNLLEAIYYLSFCKSCFNIPDQQNIKIGTDFFILDGRYDINGEEEQVVCGVQKDRKKKFSRNRKEYKRLSDHIGLIPIVMITPSDTQLVFGASEERRRFLNTLISQHNRQYLQHLVDYNRALEQRNKLLKIFYKQGTYDLSSIEIWEESLIKTADMIYKTRKELIDRLIPVFQEYYTFISGDNEKVNLEYKSDLHEMGLADHFAETRDVDKVVQHTTKGIHRDDLVFNIGDRNIKKTASQGQQKTYLVSLKFAQFDLIQETMKRRPLLLLDDVFDKLDAMRVERIIELVAGENFGQIFITDANKVRVDKVLKQVKADYRIFEVRNDEMHLVDEKT